ncbi:hypothetical protein FH972_024049 [Carpinus fangiana]|uniref:Protein kinase domain-containing protein n=1 Tax=Carpinus fangiana TaxID=176857 RepID=A0A5N6KX81_9ROSI|nr:hypothetical protein FH972_024049 [Carpinus fangiana]
MTKSSPCNPTLVIAILSREAGSELMITTYVIMFQHSCERSRLPNWAKPHAGSLRTNKTLRYYGKDPEVTWLLGLLLPRGNAVTRPTWRPSHGYITATFPLPSHSCFPFIPESTHNLPFYFGQLSCVSSIFYKHSRLQERIAIAIFHCLSCPMCERGSFQQRFGNVGTGRSRMLHSTLVAIRLQKVTESPKKLLPQAGSKANADLPVAVTLDAELTESMLLQYRLFDRLGGRRWRSLASGSKLPRPDQALCTRPRHGALEYHKMHQLAYEGSTALFFRPEPGVVLKKPRQSWAGQVLPTKTAEVAHAFRVEKANPTRCRYLECTDSGILLAEASHGSLQAYVDSNQASMDPRLRWRFCLEVAEAIAYIHEHGVVHSDLRPENYLVNATTTSPDRQSSLEVWLCDFGGSMCAELKLDGGHLPDDPFFDPRLPWTSTPATDIFSLGSILYTLLTGHWPYLNGPPPTDRTRYDYEQEVNKLFKQGKFPDVTHINGGHIVKGCWNHQYATGREVLDAIKLEMEALGLQYAER